LIELDLSVSVLEDVNMVDAINDAAQLVALNSKLVGATLLLQRFGFK
jgi:hypothetical protein